MDFGFRAAVEQARKSDDLYFSALLSKDRIDAAIRDANGGFKDGSTLDRSRCGSFSHSA